uniref:Palmitoyltransferase n=2 Tax=Hemiselmis andersenii TaxID=464988 RepID=A0A7S1EBC7_HEMAN|mmetsp:Transcript_40770/g.99297  ORF Transcript_40770/g.99297 Transcript_40770/m.99297 type:complete len:112 (+) Transcript_40770:420-755(+)
MTDAQQQAIMQDWTIVFTNIIVSGIFGVFQIAFGVHHIALVRQNATTIETIGKGRLRKRQLAVFDLGVRGNIEQVFGTNASTWALPCVQGCQGDGYTWPHNSSPSVTETRP